MPCRGRQRNTRSATSMSGCCGAAPARRCCSCMAPTACRSGCRCSTCSSKQFEVIVPEHPGFGTSDNPPWMRNIGDLAMYYLDFLDGFGPHRVHLVGQSLGGWAAAEVAVRNCSRLRDLSLLAPAGIRIKGMPSGDNFIWGPEEAVRNLYHNQAIPDQMLAMPLTDEQADIMLTNRFAATKFGWEPRWFNPSLERWLHRITRADAGHVGQGGQAVSERLCGALGRADPGQPRRDRARNAVTCRRSRSRRSPRRKSSVCTRGHADAVHILPPDALSPARHGRAPQASRRLGGAAEHAVRSEEGRRRVSVLHRPARLCREARLRRDRGQRAPPDRLRPDAGAEPDRRQPDRAHHQRPRSPSSAARCRW